MFMRYKALTGRVASDNPQIRTLESASKYSTDKRTIERADPTKQILRKIRLKRIKRAGPRLQGLRRLGAKLLQWL